MDIGGVKKFQKIFLGYPPAIGPTPGPRLGRYPGVDFFRKACFASPDLKPLPMAAQHASSPAASRLMALAVLSTVRQGSGLAGVAPDDVHHRVLAQAHIAGNEPIR